MNTNCIHPGCERSIANGDVIYRTSPKGIDFEGMCYDHHPNVGDNFIEQAIEDRNKRIRRERA